MILKGLRLYAGCACWSAAQDKQNCTALNDTWLSIGLLTGRRQCSGRPACCRSGTRRHMLGTARPLQLLPSLPPGPCLSCRPPDCRRLHPCAWSRLKQPLVAKLSQSDTAVRVQTKHPTNGRLQIARQTSGLQERQAPGAAQAIAAREDRRRQEGAHVERRLQGEGQRRRQLARRLQMVSGLVSFRGHRETRCARQKVREGVRST